MMYVLPIGMYNMEIAEENINVASNNAAYYERELANVDGIELIQMADDRQSSYWLFSMLVDRRSEFTHMMGRKVLLYQEYMNVMISILVLINIRENFPA
jgi:dTDP-4-amino-4,6-dideoxygalactose transaminase